MYYLLHLLKNVAFVFIFYMIIPTILYPEGAIINYFNDFFEFHTVTFHHLLVLYLFLAIAFRKFELKLTKDFSLIATILSAYVIIATILSYSLNVNFHNLKKCNFDALENIRMALNSSLSWFGQAVYVAMLFVCTTLVGYIAYYLISLFYKHVAKGKSSIK